LIDRANQSANFSDFPVSAGDSIEVSVYQSSTRAWVTRVDDLSTGVAAHLPHLRAYIPEGSLDEHPVSTVP
jgi:hypothetical protein